MISFFLLQRSVEYVNKAPLYFLTKHYCKQKALLEQNHSKYKVCNNRAVPTKRD